MFTMRSVSIGTLAATLVGITVVGLPVNSTQAATVYTYAGPLYSSGFGGFTTSMNISGSFTIPSSPIPPNDNINVLTLLGLEFSFSDGLHTVTNLNVTNSIGNQFAIGTNASG